MTSARVGAWLGAVTVAALTTALLASDAAAGREDAASWCSVLQPVAEPGLVAVSQPLFEDEVDTSGALAVIDILFVYSQRTGEAWGSVRLRKHVEMMVDEASAAMLNSGANARLRLVGVERGSGVLDQYEKEHADPRGSVIRWAITNDDVAELREEYGADFVYFLVDYDSESAVDIENSLPRPCAGAMQPPSVAAMSRAFAGVIDSVASRCMSGRILAHEVGHNLGLVHDKSDPMAGVPLRTGGRGFVGYDRQADRRYGTLMSRLLHTSRRYSSSTLTEDGRALGLAGEHEASEALRFAAPYAAALTRSKRAGPRFACLEGPGQDCLQEGRFGVSAAFKRRTGEVEAASVRDAYLGDNASLFYFFSARNVELLVKVVDGCASNGHFWVFGSAATTLDYDVAVADNRDGVVKRYARTGSNPLISDTSAFACGASSSADAPEAGEQGLGLEGGDVDGAGSPWRGRELAVSTHDSGNHRSIPSVVKRGRARSMRAPFSREPLPAPAPEAESGAPERVASALGLQRGCYDTDRRQCLIAGRFQVFGSFRLPNHLVCHDKPSCSTHKSMSVRDAYLGDNAALFYFFSWDNPELLVKVLDGCGVNGHYWVFGSAATDREWSIVVLARNGEEKWYDRDASNPLIADTKAFRCEPPTPTG